jgi:CHAD domain-containing protein
MAEGKNEKDETAFDVLIERMKKDIDSAEEKPAESRAGRLKSVFEAALAEAAGKREDAARLLHVGVEKARDEIRAHPTASISAAFAAGYLVGKAIAGRARK